MTDDELANGVYLNPGIVTLTAAKDRIRWLSRKVEELRAAQSDNLRKAATEAYTLLIDVDQQMNLNAECKGIMENLRNALETK